MVVQCPRCEARYRVEEELLQEEPTFKCSRCGHVFSYEPPSAFSPDTSVGSPPAKDETDRPRDERREESLAFPFAGSRRSDDEGEKTFESDELVDPEALPEPDDEEIQADPDLDEQPEVGVAETEDAPDVDEEPRFARGAFAEEDPGSFRSPTRLVLVFLAVILLVYGNLALYLRHNVGVAEAQLSSVPVLGAFLRENRLLRSQVYVKDLEGIQRTTKDGKLVFVVSGRAVNGSSQSLRRIQVEGLLYDADGEPVRSRTIYCGNAVSLKIVENVSSKELDILQNLQPPQRFSIEPGDTAGFTIVFLDPPDGLREFGTQVISARPAGA